MTRSPMQVALARSGRFVAVRRPDAIEIVDALGTAPRTLIAGDALDFTCVGAALWVLRAGAVDRYALATGRALDAVELVHAGTRLISDLDDAAIVEGGGAHLLVTRDATALALPPARGAFPLGGRRVALVHDRGLVEIHEHGRRDPLAQLRVDGDVISAHALHGGRVIAVRARSEDGEIWTTFHGRTRVHRIVAPNAAHVAIAADTGEALAIAGTRWTRIDLRYGRVSAAGQAALAADHVGLSSDGQFVVLTTGDDLVHMPAVELFAGASEPIVSSTARSATPRELRTIAEARSEDEPASPPMLEEVPVVAAARAITEVDDDVVPLAFGLPLAPLAIDAIGREWAPYASAREHLDDMLDLVAARAARGIAEAWNSGKLSAQGDRQPFEREVRALLGQVPGFAIAELGEADARVAKLATRQAGRVRATVAAGVRLPFIELMRELGLSPTAGHVLMIAFAPLERAEIARLYAILGNDRGRPLLDRFLIESLLPNARHAIAGELAAAAPLRRHGVVHVADDHPHPAFEAITVDPTAIARFRDRAVPPPHVRAFGELVLDDDARRSLLSLTARARRHDAPLRLVIRGRRGAGRRSVIAALAARVGRGVVDIDCARLPRAGGALPDALRSELRRAVLRGCVPIASALETVVAGDGELADRVRHVLRAHPGPLVVRAPIDATLPIDADHETVTLPPLDETTRAAFWRAALARTGLCCRDVDTLAARWRIGPGLIEDVIAQAHARGDDGEADATLDVVARQHIATRLAHVATPVQRLAAWEHVALADDIVDSIREFIGRIAHRKTVLEQWGFDGKVSSARGLSALFYGPPGTGKSMVAGLIARELGLELYRIDLSRVVSKWIGETEKNLSDVFDAAEDGQVVLLFDEADSLFAKRTEVKTSVDRYANLEVNYLLQRLDSFEGIAILTTNLDGSIDPAFKRRMSLRLQFPFPDEDMRQRLWAAHIPSAAPVAGDFDFRELARKFQLSGGYIRNSTLRAAYLAAQERRPLSQAHLLRAVALEYRELGKLATDGRME